MRHLVLIAAGAGLALLGGCAQIDDHLRSERSLDRRWGAALADGPVEPPPASTPREVAAGPPAPAERTSTELPPGYRWSEGTPRSLRWTPDRAHPEHPHVRSSRTEGTWQPDPGYTFQSPPALDVVWVPGTPHPDKPHVLAAKDEGNWRTEPGYTFTDAAVLEAGWRKGTRHSEFAGLVTGVEEGTWEPVPPARPRPKRVAPEAVASQRSAESRTATQEQRWRQAIPHVTAALALHYVIMETPVDGDLTTAAGLLFAMQLRNEEIGRAVGALLPRASARERSALANYVGLGLDTGFDGWGTAGVGTLDQLAVEVRRIAPGISDAYAAARVLFDLRDLYYR